jgi:hypothetical protein
VSAVLIVLGSVLAPVAVIGFWASNEVTNTGRYVENMAPLISDPAIQAALAGKISAAITSELDVKALTSQAASELSQRDLTRLSELVQNFSGEITSAVDGAVDSAVARAMASPAMATIWTEVNRDAHAALVKVLSGQGGPAVSTAGGNVTISLGPLIKQAEQELSSHGLSFVASLPAPDPTFTVFSSEKLAKAQAGYRLVSTLKWVLPLVSFGLLALGIAAARRRRHGLLGAALGLAASMAVLALALAIVRAVYLNSIPADELPRDAAAALFDGLVRFIRDGLWVIFAICLVIAAGAFLTGTSGAAATVRRTASAGIGRLGGHWRGRLQASPAGVWAGEHKTWLGAGAVALTVIIFLLWGSLSVASVAWAVLVLLVMLGLIELIGGAKPAPMAAPRPRVEV